MTDTHVDAQVVAAVTDLLTGVSGPDGQPVRVYHSRVYPDQAKALPVVCLFLPRVGAQQQTRGTPGSRIQRRSLTIHAAVVVGGVTGPDNTMESDLLAIGLQVENRMSQGFALTNPDHSRVALKASFLGRDTGTLGGGLRTVTVGLHSFLLTVDHREGAAATALTMPS